MVKEEWLPGQGVAKIVFELISDQTLGQEETQDMHLT